MKQWRDVQDQDGFWKIGYIVDREQIQGQKILKIRIDGYHPGFDTFYCNHSKKLCPVRTYTMGFNTYSQTNNNIVLRQPLNKDQIQQVISVLSKNYNRLSLISKMQNLVQNTEQNIKNFVRTQLLVLIDKIMKTPFALISNIKMCDLIINKLFIGIITFYIKLLDSSKKFLPLIDSDNKMARQLLLSIYEFSIMTKLIIGSHKNSKSFFEDPANLTIKTGGFIDFLIKSDNGILPFKIFFKNLTTVSLSKLDSKMVDAAFQVLEFFLDLCERTKGELFESNFLPQTKSVLDEIISFMKIFANLNQDNLKYVKLKVQVINRLETLQLKIKPKKTSLLRNQLFVEQKQTKKKQEAKFNSKTLQSSQQIQQLKQRVKRLQNLLGNLEQKQEFSQYHNKQSTIHKPVKNLGEEQFLASLSWALNCGDLEVAKKLVNWRQNLLRLGKIAGWEIALEVGLKTMASAEISYKDIISANLQMLKNQSDKQKLNQKLVEPLDIKIKENKNNEPQKD